MTPTVSLEMAVALFVHSNDVEMDYLMRMGQIMSLERVMMRNVMMVMLSSEMHVQICVGCQINVEIYI